MAYKVLVKPSAQKDLDALPETEVIKILSKISNLGSEPRPVGVQKLHDQEGYRIRSGNYRILFEVNDTSKMLLIYRVKHRKEVYR
ncbi:MAG: type II toxin-antitoxin system RelE/ParE family toxin [Bacteroidota bacterium]